MNEEFLHEVDEKASQKLVSNLLLREYFSGQDCGDLWYALGVKKIQNPKQQGLNANEISLLQRMLERSQKNALISDLLAEKTAIYLHEQDALLEKPTYLNQLHETPEELLETSEGFSFPWPNLTGTGKFLVGLNLTTASIWTVSCYLQILSHHPETALLNGVCAGIWASLAVLNGYIHRQKE